MKCAYEKFSSYCVGIVFQFRFGDVGLMTGDITISELSRRKNVSVFRLNLDNAFIFISYAENTIMY